MRPLCIGPPAFFSPNPNPSHNREGAALQRRVSPHKSRPNTGAIFGIHEKKSTAFM
jgi:hypothetical protein